MKNKINAPIKAMMLMLAFLGSYNNMDAQEKVTALKTGDEFLKISNISSASILQRGNVSININSISSVSKSFKIDAVNNNGYAVTMMTKKITDSVYSDDSRFYFNSDQPARGTDKLANALQFTVGKPIMFNVYNSGIIGNVDANAAKLQSDTLFNFTGIEKEDLAAGERFSIIADITSYNKLKAGDSWADASTADGDKTATKFWVITRTPLSTTIGYSSTTRGGKLNTNSNGTYVVNNTTGIITQRIIQAVTIGYQIYNRTVYSSTRRLNINESCYAMR